MQADGLSERPNSRRCRPPATLARPSFSAPFPSCDSTDSTGWISIGSTPKDRTTSATLSHFWKVFFFPFFKFGPAKTTTFYVGIELREAFEAEAQESKRPRLLLTAAVPVGPDNINGGYDVPAVSSYLDFINVMAYDFHGKWENTVGHNAPLFAPSSDSEWRKQLSVDHASNLWVRLGAPREKLIIGMGTYGRSFTLTDTNRFIVNEPASGGGTAGVYTRESGFLAYYEVKIVGESGATSWRVSSLFFL